MASHLAASCHRESISTSHHPHSELLQVRPWTSRCSNTTNTSNLLQFCGRLLFDMRMKVRILWRLVLHSRGPLLVRMNLERRPLSEERRHWQVRRRQHVGGCVSEAKRKCKRGQVRGPLQDALSDHDRILANRAQRIKYIVPTPGHERRAALYWMWAGETMQRHQPIRKPMETLSIVYQLQVAAIPLLSHRQRCSVQHSSPQQNSGLSQDRIQHMQHMQHLAV